MKKAAFYTLGCKVNQYETEALMGLFKKEGFEIIDFEEKADVYVINTCTVTSMSDRKSRQIIRKAKKQNEYSVVVVTGCYAQTEPGEVSKIPGVDLIIGTKDRDKVMEYIHKFEKENNQLSFVDDIMKARTFEELNIDTYKEHTRAFLKIQEGCSQYCAYCIIPYARGPIRSRQPESVLDAVRKLAEEGFKEVVLTGIHLASYGKDLKNISLMDIVGRVHEIKGIERIRLGSIEPTTVTEEFVQAASSLPKLCPHFHISLQSGCDETLKRMNRRYTASEYKSAVELIRQSIPDAAVTTDVMVGFPGETEAEFETTFKFLEEIRFAKMHVFKYSPRKGTPAAGFKDQVPSQIKEERSSRLIALSQMNVRSFNEWFISKKLPVLFEQEVKSMDGFYEGLTPNYIRVLCKGVPGLIGNIVEVKLCKLFEDAVIGETVEEV
ncbi:MAG: tRNA (N(6)-L-threonylcarbamoyladenosine(37)-C(2))-methylthiotransferase MtaB [Clostridia bacterium]|nr:tRNA (N(6)-L-threonylcarbamoyladenosine(37)-C(2))-methylthiotransferase MtaB [Clostridia bacterium]